MEEGCTIDGKFHNLEVENLLTAGEFKISDSIALTDITLQESIDIGTSATIGTDLNVDTNTLVVNSTNNNVGIGVDQPISTLKLDVSGNVRINGDLEVIGTTTSTTEESTSLSASLQQLGTGTTGQPSNDSGIVIERGDQPNVFMGWDESEDKFIMGMAHNNSNENITADSSGDLSLEKKDLQVSGIIAEYLTGTITSDSASQPNITGVGTITSGTWNGSPIDDTHISSAGTWNNKQDALTFGISDGNVIKCGTGIADDDFLRVNGTTLEGISSSELKTDIGLNNVENTALSTWSGSTSITTLGTITSGTWNGSTIPIAYGGTGATTASGAASALGLGTEDSPEFTSIKLGHPNDTEIIEITRDSSGVVSIGGEEVRTGIVPTNKGGTGETTYENGKLLIGNSATGGLTSSTLTGGDGITITNGNGTITITADASEFTGLTDTPNSYTNYAKNIIQVNDAANGLEFTKSPELSTIGLRVSGSSNQFTVGVDDTDSNKFKIGTTTIDTNPRLTIDSTGNVGIGNGSPGHLLDVNGDINLSGDLKVNGANAVFSNWTASTNSTDIYRDSNVGIGVTNPSNKLDVDGDINLTTTNDYKINDTSVLNETTIGSSIVNSSLTSVGALDGGSITSNFGNINIGGSTITTTGSISGGTLTGELTTGSQTNITSVGTLNTLDVKGDVVIGEDSTDLMIVNSNAKFSNDVDVGTDLVVSKTISAKNVNEDIRNKAYTLNNKIDTHNDSWVPIDNGGIVGELGDQSGRAVSLSVDGTIVAIGAWEHNVGGGTTRIYQYSSNTWIQLGSDIDGDSGDKSGISVSLSADGTIVAIGANQHDDTIDGNEGRTRIWKYRTVSQSEWKSSNIFIATVGQTGVGDDNITGSSTRGEAYSSTTKYWIQLGSDIVGDDGDESGISVSLSADGIIVAIGAYNHDVGSDSTTNEGRTRIYQYSSNTWIQLGQDLVGDTGDNSGISVSLSADGTIVAIGAHFHDVSADNEGRTRIYQYSSNTWSQLGQDLIGDDGYNFSGISVSLSADGTIVAIGAYYHDSGKGITRIYQYSSNAWSQLGQDLVGDPGDFSGISVSLSVDGIIVAIGAYNHDVDYANNSDSDEGRTRIYQYSSNTWSQLGQDLVGDPGDNSGRSVSLSADGTIVAIGASDHDVVGGNNEGRTRIYHLSEYFKSNVRIDNNLVVNSESTFNSQINMGASIIPTTNSQFDIGSAEKKVRHLYLSNNSLYMANQDNTVVNTFTKISLDSNGELQVGDNKLATQTSIDTLTTTVSGKVSVDFSGTNYTPSRGGETSSSFGDVNGSVSPTVYDALSYLTDGNSSTGCVGQQSNDSEYFDIILETSRDVIAKRVVLHSVTLPEYESGGSAWSYIEFEYPYELTYSGKTIYPQYARVGYDDGGITMLGSTSNVGTASSGHDITVSHTTARRRWVVRVWGARAFTDTYLDENMIPYDGPTYYYWGLSKIDFEYDVVPINNDVISYDGTRYVPRHPIVLSARFTWGAGYYLPTSGIGTLTTLPLRINDFSGGVIQLASNNTDITMQPGTYLVGFNYAYKIPNGYAMRAVLYFKKNGNDEDKILRADKYSNAASVDLGMDNLAAFETLHLGGIVVVSSASDVYTLVVQTWYNGGSTHLTTNSTDMWNAGYIIKLE